jgi:hypothetical protein
MTLDKKYKLIFYFTIFAAVLVTVFFIIETFYPVLIYSLALLGFSTDFLTLHAVFGTITSNFSGIIHIYLISLGILFLLNYFKKNKRK